MIIRRTNQIRFVFYFVLFLRPFDGHSQTDQPTQSTHAETPYGVHAYVNEEGILRVIVYNPQRLRFMIKLTDHQDQSVYEDISTHNNYRRWLDLSPINYGSYQLTVRIDNKPVTFKLNKQPARDIYDLHPLSAVNPEVTYAR
jgi:hypothetical protein